MAEILALADAIARLIFTLVYIVITMRRTWREDWPAAERGFTLLVALAIWAAVSP